MFAGCTSLTAIPTLPAMTLAWYCYQGMFTDCTSLTAAPALPATTLAQYCYSWMFNSCSNISAVHMPASVEGVYSTSTHGDVSKTVIYDL